VVARLVRAMGRKQERSRAGGREWLLGRVEAVPDLTLRGLVVELRDRGVVTSYGSVWRIVRDAGVTFKKTLFAVEQLGPVSNFVREAGIVHQRANLSPKMIANWVLSVGV